MLAELARRIRLHRASGGGEVVLGGGDGEEEGGGEDEMTTRIVLGEDCQVQ